MRHAKPPTTFPILMHWDAQVRERWLALGCPESIPWSLVQDHEERALLNHGQTLFRLAERGGLDPAELVVLIEGRHWYAAAHMDDEVAIRKLLEHLAQHKSLSINDGT